MSAYERLQSWVSRHKVLTGIMVVGAGYITYRAVRTNKLMRKSRRARRAKNGGRLEVVVIAGSPSLPLTKSLSLDLERRGFIVYIVCSTPEDDVLVHNLSRPDIRPLSIDITNVSTAARTSRVPGSLTDQPAPKRRRIHRALRLVHPDAACGSPKDQGQLPDLHFCYLDTLAELSDVPHRHHTPLTVCRPI